MNTVIHPTLFPKLNILTSKRVFTSALANASSLPREKNDIAFPLLPMRPVRPILCIYSSISSGRS